MSRFNEIGNYSDYGYAVATIAHLKGVVDKDAKIIVPIRYREVVIGGSFISLQTNDAKGTWSIINMQTGQFVCDIEGNRVSTNNQAEVNSAGQMCCFDINKEIFTIFDSSTNNEVLSLKGSELIPFGEGFLLDEGKALVRYEDYERTLNDPDLRTHYDWTILYRYVKVPADRPKNSKKFFVFKYEDGEYYYLHNPKCIKTDTVNNYKVYDGTRKYINPEEDIESQINAYVEEDVKRIQREQAALQRQRKRQLEYARQAKAKYKEEQEKREERRKHLLKVFCKSAILFFFCLLSLMYFSVCLNEQKFLEKKAMKVAAASFAMPTAYIKTSVQSFKTDSHPHHYSGFIRLFSPQLEESVRIPISMSRKGFKRIVNLPEDDELEALIDDFNNRLEESRRSKYQ